MSRNDVPIWRGVSAAPAVVRSRHSVHIPEAQSSLPTLARGGLLRLCPYSQQLRALDRHSETGMRALSLARSWTLG
jgi:hypothetical protein